MEKAPQNPRWNFPAKQQQQGFALSEGWTPFCSSTHYAFSGHKWFSNKHYPEASDRTSLLKHGYKSLQGGPRWWWIFSAPSSRRCSAQTRSQEELYHRCLGACTSLKYLVISYRVDWPVIYSTALLLKVCPLTFPGSWLEMNTLKSQPRPTESENTFLKRLLDLWMHLKF